MAKSDKSGDDGGVDPKVLKTMSGEWSKSFDEIGKTAEKLDKMQDDALKSLQSSDAKQQQKGQKMMQDYQSMLDDLSNMIKKHGDTTKEIISRLK